ncbi:protein kinase [Streptomyces sp. QL37]|uniref:protein kinase domain-containing protein n=1 Tax=Streptomyces sp. QL37 TaxID=2093747 RepID=UPI002917048C|nr:protein kinase [Streptomyces sp. QL37]
MAGYRLLGRLGEGGMGVVYLARSPRGRMVAVKSIRPELAAAQDFRSRFAREVAVARQVGGEWTAAVLDADPHAERPWVATAYVPGPTLAEVVRRFGPLPEESVRGLASGLCRALGDIHGAGLVHRDLKPSNVMVTIDGPKVIDFGIVRALDGSNTSGLTSTGAVIGSPGFMAPEQILGERLTPAGDIFSLGAVLAFAASGHLPFDAGEGRIPALMYRVVYEEPDLSGVPEPLLALIRDCLAKDPKARPALAQLREREETQYRRLKPWLPPEVLARLGQDAAELLEQEDPHTRFTTADRAPTHEVRTVPQPPVGEEVPDQQTGPGSDPPTAVTGTDRRLLAEARDPGGMGGFATAVYAALGVFTAVSVATVGYQILVVNSRYEADDFISVEAATVWGAAQVVSGIGLIVAWLYWFARVRQVAENYAPGRLRYRRSMSVWAWFIPVGNLFLPKQIANDIWHASSPPSQGNTMAQAGRLRTWWWIWLVALLTWPLFWWTLGWTELSNDLLERVPHVVGTHLETYADGDEYTVEEYEYTFHFETLGMINVILRLAVVPAAAIAAAGFVHQLTAMQTARRRG